MDQETWLRQQLAELLEEYQRRADPIIKALAQIESLQPPKPWIISKEEAEQLRTTKPEQADTGEAP